MQHTITTMMKIGGFGGSTGPSSVVVTISSVVGSTKSETGSFPILENYDNSILICLLISQGIAYVQWTEQNNRLQWRYRLVIKTYIVPILSSIIYLRRLRKDNEFLLKSGNGPEVLLLLHRCRISETIHYEVPSRTFYPRIESAEPWAKLTIIDL